MGRENKMELEVRLNGTDTNPFHQYGLKQNPFPQLGKYEYDSHCLQVQKLGAHPIPNADYIRETLKGFSQEFVELCCHMFQKGKMVKFTVKIPD